MHTDITIAEARQRLKFCNSYSRLPVLLDLAFEMRDDDWHAVLGNEWDMCDNIGQHRLLLRKLLPAEGPVLAMMTAAEQEQYRALPERLTVYRGCGAINMLGASWSLSREVAARFPYLGRYWQQQPLLVTATVARRHVLAVKLERQELEVITFAARRTAVEKLPPSAP